MSRLRSSGSSAPVALIWILLLLLVPMGCSDDPTDPDNDPDPVPEGDIHVDDGYVGVVVDTRSIFRKGILCNTVEITFDDHASRNSTLPVDAVTNLATLSFDTDDLTDDELAAFGAGVAATVVVKSGSPRAVAETVIAEIAIASLVLDSRNIPLSIGTDLQSTRQPVALREDMPYLIQYRYSEHLMAQTDQSRINFHTAYDQNDPNLQFYFTAVDGEPYVYTVSVIPIWWNQLLYWADNEGVQVIADTDDYLPRLQVTMEQDEEGWVAIRLAGSDRYLQNSDDYALVIRDAPQNNFRLICDRIQWSVIDRGTKFNQPIMPPARLDFAYKATLRNCSPGELQEQVGVTESRTSTTTFETMESLQLFQSTTESFNVKISMSVTGKVGLDIEGIGEVGEEVTVSEEISMGYEYTNSQTQTQQRTWSSSTSKTKQVSRVRTTTVPPQTGIEVYDAVKTIENVIVPFTQVLRIRGVDKDTTEPLTGEEIRSQMLFSFVGGVIAAVGNDYVDITLRGRALIDQMFEATTNQEEIIGACD